MQQIRSLLSGDLAQVIRGFLMGGADIIPGVSGGTIALILGIYTRLVGAISRVDTTFLGHLRAGRWRDAWEYLDGRFLVTLALGIGLGVISLAGVMHYLLMHQRMWTLAAFFGLISGSIWLVARMIPRWQFSEWVLVLTGAVSAFWLVGLPMMTSPPDHWLYTFFCGTVAICAMILPGISGAFILLLLGKYVEITGLIKGLVHGEISGSILLTIFVFGCGCLTGLLAFSKLLKILLARRFSETMALLCGLMAGSLRKLFPFQYDATPEVEELKHKQFLNRELIDIHWMNELLPAVLIAILAAGFVLLLSYLSHRKAVTKPSSHSA